MTLNTKTIIAVVSAAVIGTIANAGAIAAFVDPGKLGLALVPGRHGVALALCAALPLLAGMFSGASYYVVATLWLTLGSSLLAKLVFGAGAPWVMVLGFNLVFAIVAITVFSLICARARA